MNPARSQTAQSGALAGHGPDACELAILVAVAEESAAIRSRIRPHLVGCDGRLHGEWRGRAVRLQETGPGMARAEAAARRLLGAVRPRLLVCGGLSGGLHPAIERGALVVAEQVVSGQGDERFAADPHSLQAASDLGARSGVLMTSSRVVCTVAEKHALSARAALVDMESLAVARVAAEFEVPFLAVRVISDSANEGFPLDLNRYLDDRGEVRRTPLALAALRRRGGLKFLLGLRAAALEGSQTLAGFLEKLLEVV